MELPTQDGGTSTGTDGAEPDGEQNPPQTTMDASVGFALRGEGGVRFAPLYPPSDPFTFRKDRNLDRQEQMCEGEAVTDGGSKNREIGVSGKMRDREMPVFDAVLDSSERFMLVTPGWSGWVRVDEGEYRGPVGWDSQSREILWSYSIDLVSTGDSEYDNFDSDGIIN